MQKAEMVPKMFFLFETILLIYFTFLEQVENFHLFIPFQGRFVPFYINNKKL